MNKSFKDSFTFSKKELNGLLIFGILLLLVAFAPLIYSYFKPPEVYNYDDFKKEIESFRASAKRKPSYKYNAIVRDEIEGKELTANMFEFNPNNLPASDWKSLGLSDKQIKVIKNYEAKGGRFYKKEDLKKIYSIKSDDYARLEPFINIPEKVNSYKSENAFKKPDTRKLIVVDLNSADSVQLESLNGIGTAFASRIIKYRNRLGGFCRKEQLREVYGIDSVLYMKLAPQVIVNGALLKKINVNEAAFEDLKRLPYLSYKQINVIIRYRQQHGKYKDLTDLTSILILDKAVLDKIEPYLTFK